MTWQKWDWYIVFGLFLWVLFLRLPSVAQPFENDSSSIAYHARLVTEGDVLYGNHHPTHHLPGTYYVYATAFAVLGDTPASVKVVLLVWIWATAVMIYLVGKQLSLNNRWLGFFASVAYALVTANILLAGTNSKVESWLSLWQITAVFLLLHYRSNSDPKKFALIGLFAGLTVVFKVNYVSSVALVGILLLVQLWQDRAWRPVIMRGLWFSAGFVTPLILTGAFFALSGAWQGLLDVFRLGFSYVQIETQENPIPLMKLFYPLALLGQVNVVLVVGGLMAVFVHLRQLPRTYKDEPYLPAISYIVLWFALCFIEAGASSVFLNNYYLVFAPPLALLTGWVLMQVATAVRSRNAQIALFSLCLLILVVWGMRGVQKRHYTSYYVDYLATGEITYDQFLQQGLPDGVGDTMLILQDVAEYIQANTTPEQRIYNWSPFVQLYYLSERRSTQQLIWALYVDAITPQENVFTAEYIVIGSERPLGYGDDLPLWLQEGLDTHYELETTIHGQQLYRRQPEA